MTLVTSVPRAFVNFVRVNSGEGCGSGASVVRRYYCCGVNVTCTISVVSDGPDSNFHLFTASVAASTSTGFPPSTRVDLTVPFGLTTASIFTVPCRRILLASSGYTGATRAVTFRSDVDVLELCAAVTAAHATTITTKYMKAFRIFEPSSAQPEYWVTNYCGRVLKPLTF